MKSELYQSGLGAEALQALAELAKVADRNEEAKALAAEFEKQKPKLEAAFWSPEHKLYAFALDPNGKRVDEPSVLATVPMWFGLLDVSRSKTMIEQLAARDHTTDWGLRIISDHSPLYSAGGYHFGSVWPLFGGWASVGEYRYHQAHPGLQALRANALLALDGSPIGLLSQRMACEQAMSQSRLLFTAPRTKWRSKSSALAAANAFWSCSRRSVCAPKSVPSN